MPKDRTPSPFSPWESILYGLIAIILLTTIAYALSGCVTKKACERRYGPCGQGYVSITTEKVPWSIYLPGAEVSTKVALWQATYSELRHDTLVYTDSAARARLTLAIDSLGNLYARCQALPVKVDTFVVNKTTVERVVDTQTEQVTPWWNWLIMSILTLFLLGLLLKSVFG